MADFSGVSTNARSISQNPKMSAWIVAAMLAIVAVPVGITLHTVKVPATILLSSSNPTPFGYSWSLLLFIIPILVIGGWFLPSEQVRIPKRAFWRTIWILVPIGFGLDFFFAHRFFEFKNSGATLGIGAPAIGRHGTGRGICLLLHWLSCRSSFYVWLDEYWLAAYNCTDCSGSAAATD